MDTSISRAVGAPAGVMFELAARVEDWPRLLPHYRWVRVIETSPDARTVEMAARRDVLGPAGIPLRWTAVQRVRADHLRIEFRHIRGITRGMWVEWSITATASGCEARIRHVFSPGWPVPDRLIHLIVGEYFVNGVARRTLRHLAQRAEDPS